MPAKKKNTPAPIASEAEKVEREAHRSSARSGLARSGRSGDEGDRGEAREQRKPERDVLDARDLGRRGGQEQRGDAAGAEELDGHHPVDLARAVKHADEAGGDRHQDESRGGEQQRHSWPIIRMKEASSAARSAAIGWRTSSP